MLDSYGQLTDIGSWYLGGNATGNIPRDTAVKPNHTAPLSPTALYTVPALVTEDADSRGLVIRPWLYSIAFVAQILAICV
jgi:hypothetical protein